MGRVPAEFPAEPLCEIGDSSGTLRGGVDELGFDFIDFIDFVGIGEHRKQPSVFNT